MMLLHPVLDYVYQVFAIYSIFYLIGNPQFNFFYTIFVFSIFKEIPNDKYGWCLYSQDIAWKDHTFKPDWCLYAQDLA